jgi:hypothetical protein
MYSTYVTTGLQKKENDRGEKGAGGSERKREEKEIE